MTAIIWTRAGDDWQRDIDTAKAVNVDPGILMHIPCVSFKALSVNKDIPAANYVIFNSSNAVRFSMAVEPLAAVVRAAVKIFAIGTGTAETLTAFGLSATPGFSGNSAKDLADQLLNLGVGGSFIIPTAAQSAFDTAAYLAGHGRQAVSVPCYTTTRLAVKNDGLPFSADDLARLKSTLAGIICFASPSAVQGFNATFDIKNSSLKNRLLPVAIGSTTMKEVLHYFPDCEKADQNSVPALLKKAFELRLLSPKVARDT